MVNYDSLMVLNSFMVWLSIRKPWENVLFKIATCLIAGFKRIGKHIYIYIYLYYTHNLYYHPEVDRIWMFKDIIILLGIF